MDELEFRRRLFSDPSAADLALQQGIDSDKAKAQLQLELQQLDAELHKALQIDVPDDLQARLLLMQQVASYRQKRQRNQWRYGIAAAIALALGFVQFRYEPLYFGKDLGSYALAHVYHEASALVNLPQQLPLTDVNTMMASYALQLDGFDGKVRYAQFCHFRGVRSLHLILDSSEGPVTVFVLPKGHQWQNAEPFADDNFHGQSLALASVDLVLVAAKKQSLTPMVNKLPHHFTVAMKQNS